MIFEKETALLRKGLFDVQNEVGLGHREEMYHKAMTLWLDKQNIPYSSKAPHPLLLNAKTAHTLYPDIIAWDKITIELKAVPRHLQDSDHVQIFNYLKRRNDRLGLLVNMGTDRVFAKRIVYDPPDCEWIENWDSWKNQIDEENRETGLQIRNILRTIYDTHKTGYGTEIVEELILFGLQEQNVQITAAPTGKSFFQGNLLGETSFDCLLINDRLLLVFTALFDDNQFNIGRGLSFMKSLNIPWGIAVNFGKKNVHLTGLSLRN